MPWKALRPDRPDTNPRPRPAFPGERLLDEILGLPLRTIAETERRGIVPPGAVIVGGAKENFVANVRMLETDATR